MSSFSKKPNKKREFYKKANSIKKTEKMAAAWRTLRDCPPASMHSSH